MRKRAHRSTRFDWVIALCLGAILSGSTVAAEKTLGPRAAEEKIFAALEEETSLEMVEEPLSHVVAYLMDLHGIKIHIDERALKDYLLGADEPITKSLNGISLASGLNLMLRDLDLTWTIVDEVLLITTPREAEEHLVTRMYDVGDPGNRSQYEGQTLAGFRLDDHHADRNSRGGKLGPGRRNRPYRSVRIPWSCCARGLPDAESPSRVCPPHRGYVQNSASGTTTASIRHATRSRLRLTPGRWPRPAAATQRVT